MTLGFFALVVAVGASYRLTRLIVEDTIFDAPRTAAFRWLTRGETELDRAIGTLLVAVAATLAAVAATLRLVAVVTNNGDGSVTNGVLGAAVAASLALGFVGATVGFRFYLSELISCRWCVGVWTSAAVAASLAAWGRWPIVPTCVFGLATAGFQCFLNTGEALLATILEGLDDANDARLDRAIEDA